jgi:hypothetical protein
LSDQPTTAADLEHAATLEALAQQRNLFGNSLAVANAKLAVAHAQIAELEKQLKAARESLKETPNAK